MTTRGDSLKHRHTVIYDISGDAECARQLETALQTAHNRTMEFTIKRFLIDDDTDGLNKLHHLIRGDVAATLLVLRKDQIRSLTAEKTMRIRPMIAVVKECDTSTARELFVQGASDLLYPPFDPRDVAVRIDRLTLASPQETIPLNQSSVLSSLVGESDQFMSEIRKIPSIANCDATVLILGETGTGKELCARAIHYLSPRKRGPFVPVNCGALPLDLVENELFGHEQGAYTGANGSSTGLVSSSHEGTLFLDEIDSLPLPAQAKLLRLIQEKEYRKLGSRKTLTADVRIVAATNRDPHEAINTSRLREDLYYRLNILSLNLPPLRDREEDIPMLANHFLTSCRQRFHKGDVCFSHAALQKLTAYHWPGNIRELQNVVARAVVLCDNNRVQPWDLELSGTEARCQFGSLRELKNMMIEKFERRYIQQVLDYTNGNISRAAREARKHRRAFWELMRKYDIKAEPHGKSLTTRQPVPLE